MHFDNFFKIIIFFFFYKLFCYFFSLLDTNNSKIIQIFDLKSIVHIYAFFFNIAKYNELYYFFFQHYLDFPNAKRAAVLWNILKDFTVRIIGTVASIILQHTIEI